jgi:hypothetical protein
MQISSSQNFLLYLLGKTLVMRLLDMLSLKKKNQIVQLKDEYVHNTGY